MAPWIKKFLEALDEEHRTLLITFFNSQGCMDWCYQNGFFYQLSGPETDQWSAYFRHDGTNMIVRAVTWWDNEPLWEGSYDDVTRLIETPIEPAPPKPSPEFTETRQTKGTPPLPPLPISPTSPPAPPSQTTQIEMEDNPKVTSTQKRITVPVDQLVGVAKKATEDSSPTATIPDAYLQRKAGSVPYLYVDPHKDTPYWVGRQEPCDTVINDLSLSRKHCRFEGRNGHLVLIDGGSTNGSYVNEQRVEGEIPVKPGDLVRVGRAMFILRHTPEP